MRRHLRSRHSSYPSRSCFATYEVAIECYSSVDGGGTGVNVRWLLSECRHGVVCLMAGAPASLCMISVSSRLSFTSNNASSNNTAFQTPGLISMLVWLLWSEAGWKNPMISQLPAPPWNPREARVVGIDWDALRVSRVSGLGGGDCLLTEQLSSGNDAQ